MKKRRSCGILLVRGDPVKEILLLNHPTRLDVAKGRVEPGETDIECALREMEEETGITAADVELDPDFRFVLRYMMPPKPGKGDREKTLVMFLGHLKRRVPIVLTEHVDYEWLPWNPPHRIQKKTIDPLLAHLEEFLATRASKD